MATAAFEIGERVELRFYPYCIGTVIDIAGCFRISEMVLSPNYTVRWDDEELGETSNLRNSDLYRYPGGR